MPHAPRPAHSRMGVAMTFTESVGYCLMNYFTVSGRGGRSEYWWFILASFIAGVLGSIVDIIIGFQIVGPLVALAVFIPTITAATRRLHDIDRSGWWQLIALIPLLGGLLLLVSLASRGTDGPNRFGRAPAGAGLPSPLRA